MKSSTMDLKTMQNSLPQYLCLALYIASLYAVRMAHVNVLPPVVLGEFELTYNAVRTFAGIVITVATVVLYRRIDPHLHRPQCALFAATVSAVGSLAIFIPAHLGVALSGVPLLALVFFANLLAWTGGSLTALVVYAMFVRLPSKTSSVICAFVLAMVLNSFMAFCSALGCAVLNLIIPFAIFFLMLQAPKPGKAGDESKTLQADTVDTVGLTVGYLGFIFVFSLGTSFSRWLYLYGASPDPMTRCFVMLLCTAFACVVIWATKRSYLRLNAIALYRATFLFFVISFGCAVIFPHNGEVTYSMQFVADFLFRTLTFVTIYRICQRSDLSLTLVVGVTTILRLVASLVFNFVEVVTPANDIQVSLVVAVFMILFALVYTTVYTERNMETLTERRKPRGETFIMESKCLAMGNEYGFSKRELEIVRHLCQGRTAAFIADELFVSPRTVNTHIRNIYKKMDIHSRQEFHDAYQAQRAEPARILGE